MPHRSLSIGDLKNRTTIPMVLRRGISDPLIVCYRELYGSTAGEKPTQNLQVNAKRSVQEELKQHFQAFTIASIERLQESMNPRFMTRLRQRQEANVSKVIQERRIIDPSGDVIQTRFIIF